MFSELVSWPNFSCIISNMIEPINARQQTQVIDHTADYVALAGQILGRKYPPVDVVFDLIGSSSGMFRVSERHCEIRYNPWIFAKFFEESLSGTVPHEVAHYIAHEVYGLDRVRPHGPEWREIMAAFDADPSVTCDFDLAGIPQRRQRRFSYHCECREHRISTRCHNRIQQGKDRYLCRHCGIELMQQA